MQRAKVTAVTSSGLYVQTADLDNVGPCQAVTATYAVGEMVLVVNVGDENRPDLVVVGKVSATGTAATSWWFGTPVVQRWKLSATESTWALTRYDSGGVSQGNAVSVTNSSGNVSLASSLYVSGGLVQIKNPAGTSRDLQFYSGSNPRWIIRASSTAESGSDAGSDFIIYRYNDSNAASAALTITRATGRVTIGAVGSTAGLEFGSSGPRMMMGTGGPSGISAPVGSTWRQTDANSTHGSLSGLLWNKVGTDTTEGTDWLVDYEGRWATYTPTWSNVSMSATTAKYTLTGKLCHFNCIGTLSAAPSGAVTVTTPLTMLAAAEPHGPVRLRRSSSYQGSWFYNSSTSVVIRYLDDANIWQSLSSTAPASWASGDKIYVSGTFEVA